MMEQVFDDMEALAKINVNLPVDDLDQLNDIWATSAAWPDVAPGLDRLKRKYWLATLGNADRGDTARLVREGAVPTCRIIAA
jgi:2-haloacid dehalogenase